MSYCRALRRQFTCFGMSVGALLAALPVAGCSANDHPPFIAPVGGGGGRQGAAPPDSNDSDLVEEAGASNAPSDAPSDTPNDTPGGAIAGGEVYLLAPLKSDAQPLALSRIETPEAYSFGLCAFCGNAQFRGTQLVYSQGPGSPVRTFVPDLGGSPAPQGFDYPSTLENDPIIPTPACNAGPKRFLTGPGGELYYLCDDGYWYSDNTKLYKGEWQFLTIGARGLVLVRTDFLTYGVLNLSTGDVTPADELPRAEHFAVRWHASGFHLVLDSLDGGAALHEVHADGTSTQLGRYVKTAEGGSVLTPNDAYVIIGYTDGNPDTVGIDRLGLDGSVEHVYTTRLADSIFDLRYATLLTSR